MRNSKHKTTKTQKLQKTMGKVKNKNNFNESSISKILIEKFPGYSLTFRKQPKKESTIWF